MVLWKRAASLSHHCQLQMWWKRPLCSLYSTNQWQLPLKGSSVKFLQAMLFGLILTCAVNAQENPQQEDQHHAEDVAEVTSLYEVTLVLDLKVLEENENFNSLVNELKGDTPDIKEILINKFKSQYPTIVKLDLFQRNMLWTPKKEDNENTILFIELSKTQVRALQIITKDTPIALTLKESSEKPALKFSEEQLNNFKKNCDPKDHKWVGLKYEELMDLSFKEKAIVMVNSLDKVSIGFPLDGTEEGETLLTVEIENGVVVKAVSMETSATPLPR